ncbi:MAG TPA: glucose-6-phosphate isomerase [Thermoanaerobaculia bacterium]|jgi:glucose-6-phosphate isomerase/transaldolase/glucose-6-phosphate isomerase|nr:glucose-6-phosphate isomerase [Thermoanaerobaculia bacterium]
MMQPLPAPLSDAFESALSQLEHERFVERIWRRDHTLWSPEPREIADRLGWLDLLETDEPLRRVASIVEEAHAEDVGHIVLLGMGGSSLGGEALASTFGPQEGYPRLLVLDSTVPDRVRQVRAAIDPRRTLFIAASKSGGTAEVQALFDYFWGEVTGSDDPGRRFLAITDPGTPLAALGVERGFREVFLNTPDVGGRFSVLTLFGVVPAALAGIDMRRLLGRAERARRACGPQHPGEENPGLLLGTYLAVAALLGRDKATLLVPRRVADFGLWAEQLLAESTGKNGKGIVPVAGEPFVEPAAYGDDRAFVHLRLTSEPDAEVEAQAARLREAGQPVWELTLAHRWDLGAQFFLWQFATAVAGHLLDVHPFDQPNVESAKKSTREVLAQWETSGKLPAVEAPADLAAELRREKPAYVALLGYLAPDSALEASVARLRRALIEELHVATTFGYGPRYLHSTGQLHKGGPPGGLHVEVVPRAMADLPIAGRRYGFATLAGAQAEGDLLALRDANRRFVRITSADPAADLARMAEGLLTGPG